MIRAITYKIKLNELQDFIAIVRIKYGMKFKTNEIIMIYDIIKIPFIHYFICFIGCALQITTLISLINVEVGINVEGVQKCKITKHGGGNKPQFLS